MIATLLIASLFGFEAEPVCFSSEVQALCCPSACAVRNSPKWTEADDVLRACAKGIGCKSVDSWSVSMRCNCPPKSGAS